MYPSLGFPDPSWSPGVRGRPGWHGAPARIGLDLSIPNKMIDNSHRMPTKCYQQICVWQFNFFLRTVRGMLWKRLSLASIYFWPLYPITWFTCLEMVFWNWGCNGMFRFAAAWGNTAEQSEACGTWRTCQSGDPASHREPAFAIPTDHESSFLPRAFSSDCQKFNWRRC